MPRPVNSSRTSRVQVAPSQNVFQYRVVAPGPGSVGAGNAGQAAQDLAAALGVGAKVYETENKRRDESFRLAGERDFNLGTVDEKLREKQRSYNRAVTQNEMEANWLADVDAFDQSIREMDLESLDPEEQLQALNATIDELYQQQYGGLDDPDAAEVLVPRMEKYRQAKLQELIETHRAMAQEKIDADLQSVVRGYAESAREAALEANPDVEPFEVSASAGFDYLGLHARVRALKPGAETNDTYFAILKDIAIRTGDPDLLRNIPERWADGTPSFRSIPGFNDKILAAEQQAEAMRDANAKAHAKALKEQREAEEAALAAQGYELALTGTNPTAFVLEQMRAGMLPGKMGNSIVQAYRSAQEYDANGTTDPDLLMSLQARVLSTPESVTDEEIYAAWGQGAFGDPNQPEATEALRQMLKDREQSRSNAKDLATNPRATAYVDRFKTSFSPKVDPITGGLIAPAAERMFYAEMLSDLREKIASGEDPARAYREIEEEYVNRIERVRSADDGSYDTTADAVSDMLQGRIAAPDVVLALRSRGVPTGTIVSDLKTLYQQQTLTRDQYGRLLAELDK